MRPTRRQLVRHAPRPFFTAALAAVFALTVLAATGAAAGGSKGGGGGGKTDKSPPAISIASAQQGGTSLTLTGTASDNVGVTLVDVSVDGGTYAAASGTTNWTYTVNESGLTAGSHTATVRARDAAGNTATASTTFTVVASSPPAPTDTTPPSTSISTPTANANVTGTLTVAGTASDNVQVAKVDVSLDGGAYQSAQGTTTWSASVGTSTLPNGSHTLTARATDSSGNVATTSETIDVANDTTPPSATITVPSTSATVSGTVSVSGTATDNVSVAKVELSVDGGAYTTAQGTSTWSASLNTTTLSNGSHTLTARATDTNGNTATSAGVTVTVSNSLPTGVKEQLVTPEGVTIKIESDAVGWTAQEIYDLLKPNAYQLNVIGPALTIDVTAQYSSQTSTSASSSDGVWGNYHATITLQANGTSAFATRPDAIIAHEYGHAWTNYYYYVKWQRDWTPWLQERGLIGNPLVDSSYQWSIREMIADDYRLLFGTSLAQSEMSYINPAVADPRAVAGFKDWFSSTWA